MIKHIIIFIPSMTGIIIVKILIWMILLNSIWFNKWRCINNTIFLWFFTTYSISFTRFNFLYITPRTISCTNTKNFWCKYTCYKTKNLGSRKWIFLMPQMNMTISDIFALPEKFITIKWTIIVIKVSLICPKQFKIKMQLIFRQSMKQCLD